MTLDYVQDESIVYFRKTGGRKSISVLNRIEIPTIDAQTNLAAARRIKKSGITDYFWNTQPFVING